ncbi:MAG: hypothetical protein M1540_01720, partial [Candidatus Bathyarchaeota archaeon]|nr:hypothetical protein [Candidatus Bathyarchaeota archaeon]
LFHLDFSFWRELFSIPSVTEPSSRTAATLFTLKEERKKIATSRTTSLYYFFLLGEKTNGEN